jgi:hypothetical protein
LLEICDYLSQICIATFLPHLKPSQLAIQTFAQFPKQPILFLQLLHPPAKLRIPSPSLRQLVAVPRNCFPSILVFALKDPQRFFET